jgi:hypothetical protein
VLRQLVRELTTNDTLWLAGLILGAGVLAFAVLVWLDAGRNLRDGEEEVGLDILESEQDRGEQDDATEAELHGWADYLHTLNVAPSPLLHRRLALDEHEPLTWEQRRRVFGTRIREQRRRLRLIGDATQQFEAIADEAGFPVSEHGPVEPERSVWDEDSETWVKDTARQLPLPLRGLRPIRGAR